MRSIRPFLVGLAVAVAAAAAWPSAQTGDAPVSDVVRPDYSFAEPGVSPDGRTIAFVSGGDIWSVAAAGGDARLLVAGAADDRRPLFSPDGRQLAFVSTRTGGGDIYVLALDAGRLQRLTWDDGLDELDAWSRDGRWLYYRSTSRDIAGMNDIYRVPATGGTPTPVSEEPYVNEFDAAPAPDGQRLAFAARGIASSQWWRKGSSHLDQSELWLLDLPSRGYTRLTNRDSRQVWPMWSGDGQSLFYVSDRGGAENLWTRGLAPDAPDRQLTAFRDGRVLFPSASSDGRTIAFERDFGVWTLDTATGRASEVPIVRRGAAATPAPERVRQTDRFSGLALSPDGRKVAFIARGDVFAASARDGGDAARVTRTPEVEALPVWAPDSRRLAYLTPQPNGRRIALFDFTSGAEQAVTPGTAFDGVPAFSPDGARLAFVRDRRELHVLDLGTKQDRVVTTGTLADTSDEPRPVWSPDGKWIALFVIGAKAFTNVSIVPADGSQPARAISFLANVFSDTIVWTPDGTAILFTTRQRTENGQLARVELTLKTPKFREDLFRDLFSPARPAAPPPVAPVAPDAPVAAPAPTDAPATRPTTIVNVSPVFDDIRQRLSFVPVGLDVLDVAINPDGKTAAVIAAVGGQTNLYSYSLDELAAERPVARQLSTTAGAKSDPQFTPDGREIYFLDAGRVQIASVERRDARPLAVTAELTVDFAAEKAQVFDQAWSLLRDNFFDASFNGVDWNASRTRYGARAAWTNTTDELRRVVSLMIGDLNASHMGISGPADAPVIGRLGLRFDAREHESSGRLRVTSVVPLGPAAVTREITPGAYVTAVDGRPIGPGVNLDELLANTIDRRIVLSVASRPGGPVREVPVRPTNQATEKTLLYRAWVEKNRAYVLEKSGGRLGYAHMLNMTAAALDQLHLDLDTENHARDGVVIDIRNNNGGFVNAYAIDVFTRQPYLRMSTRLVPEAPARTMLGQRALESPTVLVTNQHSLSDAEDFTEGYRTLKLGPVVGEPTAGWIIYTSNVSLVDGSILRLPRIRVKGADGQDMERHPRPVDVPVARPLGESATGRDTQLDEAIKVLLGRL